MHPQPATRNPTTRNSRPATRNPSYLHLLDCSTALLSPRRGRPIPLTTNHEPRTMDHPPRTTNSAPADILRTHPPLALSAPQHDANKDHTLSLSAVLPACSRPVPKKPARHPTNLPLLPSASDARSGLTFPSTSRASPSSYNPSALSPRPKSEQSQEVILLVFLTCSFTHSLITQTFYTSL
jgi:hypothetical protein